MDYSPYDLIIFGVDGVIRTAVGDDKFGRPLPTPNDSDQWTLLPRVKSTFRDLRKEIRRRENTSRPLRIAFTSNQGGVEHGIISAQKARNLIKEAVIEAFDGDFAPFEIKICTETDQNSPMRKPNAGMVNALIEGGHLERKSVIVIGGDMDRQMADSAKVAFMSDSEYFDR
jgi:histidinol phosphatase-like enzyme